MFRYISNLGGSSPVDFETAILDGFASDGGLYVPESIPKVSFDQLNQWKGLGYVDLAFEVLSMFIERSVISEDELKDLLESAYSSFEKEEIIPLYKLESRKNTYIMELFYGPSLSFKDVGMAFLVNLVNFFLKKRNEFLSLIIATTGDTGPAAAYFSAGQSNVDAWILYPEGMITEEQKQQMSTLPEENIFAVSVANCPDGGDNLDEVIAKLYANKPFKNKLKLSSVNSINWGRIMMQTVHYFYGYLQLVDKVGEQINVSVPSGGFGNLCAGGLAREMGLPVKYFVAANNDNACLHRIFSEGICSKVDIHETVSSAIDILFPINFWRYLYFTGTSPDKIKTYMDTFKANNIVQFKDETYKAYNKRMLSYSASDTETLAIIKEIYHKEGYLLDPHAAVSVVAADILNNVLGNEKLMCLATAHPAKFPEVIQKALNGHILPAEGRHQSIETARIKTEREYKLNYVNLEAELIDLMESKWDSKK